MEMAETKIYNDFLQQQDQSKITNTEASIYNRCLAFDDNSGPSVQDKANQLQLPSLLRFLSAGFDYPPTEIPDAAQSPSSELRRGSSVPAIYFQDVEKGTMRPSRLRACLSERISPPEPQNLTLTLNPHAEANSFNCGHLRSCQSERLSAPDTELPSYPDQSVNYRKKKMAKFSKVAFGGRKVAPERKIGQEITHGSRRDKPPYKKTQSQKRKFHSQPILGLSMDASASAHHVFDMHSGPLPGNFGIPRTHSSYDIFKTRTAMLEKPFARLYSRQNTDQIEPAAPTEPDARRYFSALEGPELDILRDSEDTVLSVDKKWPFLLRFPIGCFGICLGLGSQTILWKTLSTAASMHFMHVPKLINLALWCLALMTLVMVFATYSLKCLFYFEAVRREFYHPVRINFFFAPWIACMFLTLGVPHAVTIDIHPILWVIFMAPIFILELKIYGQWLSGGAWRLSKVANPSTHLSLVGNFVGALLAATVDWKELAIFFWAVGLAHYIVLFVTLYQRLPTAAVLPKELHPVFFLFVAAPCTASVAWAKIVGDFDLVSRIAYFVGLFLYSSLVVRVNFFRGFRFSVAWWAYTFPMTASAIATIHYSLKVNHPFTKGLAVVLSFISSITVLSLCLFTFLHIFFWRNMFPNDVAIAITNESTHIKRKMDMGDSPSLGTSPESYKSKGWLPGKSFLNEMRRVESQLLPYRSDPTLGI